MIKIALVTGGAGYIGSWVTKYLLEDGYTVRVTLRDKSKTEKYQHLIEIANSSPGFLEIWEADLVKDGAFEKAVEGCEVVFHIASPFILNVNDAQKDLVDPAVKGTKAILDAVSTSSTVKKVILTSSVASIYGDNVDMKNQNLTKFTEDHWNTTSSLAHQPYSFSKVEAEKEAWKIANNQNQWQLIVINPSFVMGPPLSLASHSESLKFMKDILSGKFASGAPNLIFGFVDVRDVAKAHIFANQKPNLSGRFILSAQTLNFMDLVNTIKGLYGNKYKLPKFVAPKWLLSLFGFMFGVSRKFVQKNVGHHIDFDNSKSKNILGVNYHPFDQTIMDMVDFMQKNDLESKK